MNLSVTLNDQEWYEITVLLRRGLDEIKRGRRDRITKKWIARYEHMIDTIDDAFLTD